MGFIETGYEIGLADELSSLLESGEWRKKTEHVSVAEKPKELSPFEKATQINFLINNVFYDFLMQEREGTTRREDERDFLEHFKESREKKLSHLRQYNTQQSNLAAHVIEGTTIMDVHAFSESQFDTYAREMGRNLIGSQEYEIAKVGADYWSKGEQIAKGSVNLFFEEKSL